MSNRSGAFIIVKDCRRFLVVFPCKGEKLMYEDTMPKLNRSALELLDEYCAGYQEVIMPHITTLTRLRAVALSLRRQQPTPNLP